MFCSEYASEISSFVLMLFVDFDLNSKCQMTIKIPLGQTSIETDQVDQRIKSGLSKYAEKKLKDFPSVYRN